MSESNINLLNIIDMDMVYTGAPVAQSELPHIGAVFTMLVPLCNGHLISKPMVVLAPTIMIVGLIQQTLKMID
jgi:hypothetical protein